MAEMNVKGVGYEGYPPQQAPCPIQPAVYCPQVTQPVALTSGYVVSYVVSALPMVTLYYGEHPVRIQCPHCLADVVTKTEFSSGNLTWLACLTSCLLGCFLGCCLIPFCVNASKDVIHRCPNCEQQVGVYRRI